MNQCLFEEIAMEEWGKELCCKFELPANLTIPDLLLPQQQSFRGRRILHFFTLTCVWVRKIPVRLWIFLEKLSFWIVNTEKCIQNRKDKSLLGLLDDIYFIQTKKKLHPCVALSLDEPKAIVEWHAQLLCSSLFVSTYHAYII